MRIDDDLKKMSSHELQKEVMRVRTALRKELSDTGNRRCWITLLEALPEGKRIKPLTLSKEEFISNCAKYYKRNQ
jgi:hypothetical protein